MKKPPPEIMIADVSGYDNKHLDLAYASGSDAQKLDIYLPSSGEGLYPLIIFIHGGGFEMGNKRDSHVLMFIESGLPRGYAVASLNHRKSGEAVFPAAVQDLKTAVRWLRANSVKYQLDPDRFVIWGASSGGNLAAMHCLTAGVGELDEPSPQYPGISSGVQVCVDWFGPTDFLLMDQQFKKSGLGPADHGEKSSPESHYLGKKISEVPELVIAANPLTYIHPDIPPILIQHGELDDHVPVEQSMIFADKLTEIVGPAHFEFDILEGAGHGGPEFETEENLERIFTFLDKHL